MDNAPRTKATSQALAAAGYAPVPVSPYARERWARAEAKREAQKRVRRG